MVTITDSKWLAKVELYDRFLIKIQYFRFKFKEIVE